MTAQRWLTLGAVLIAIVAASAVTWTVARPSPPGAGSAEVGFAQDMSAHHAQAVSMAGIVMASTDDEGIVTLARDIQLTQQGQIGQMQAWLDLWDQPATTVGPRMAWMSVDGTGMSGRMPGMASPAQLAQLRDLEGVDAERLFLELMIEHHAAGVTMAQAAVDRLSVPEVRRLAAAMVDGQQVEIEAMTALLPERGG